MKEAAKNTGIQNVRWGGAWHIHNIAAFEGDMGAAKESYIQERRDRGKKPFIDGPHFELYTPGDVATKC